VSGDRLARMEADARKTLAEDASSSLALWKPWAMDRAADVLALVEIARAARHYLEGTDPDGYINLRAALARLDRPSSDGTTDSGAAEGDT
jgi:hypothetical protein